jgi:hypothetical protein
VRARRSRYIGVQYSGISPAGIETLAAWIERTPPRLSMTVWSCGSEMIASATPCVRTIIAR